MKEIYLHIGTHKTGSSSIQAFLLKRKDFLQNQGYSFYEGHHIDRNHIELYLSSMREERDSFAKEKMSLSVDQEYREKVTSHVHDFIQHSPTDKLIFSTEGLSLLRYEDEINTLKNIVQSNKHKVHIILFLRDKREYLESFRKQIQKNNRSFSIDPESVFYVEGDSWLIDYERLIEVFSNGFGKNQMIVMNYDKEVEKNKNIVASFLQSIGINNYNEEDISLFFLNQTYKRKKFKQYLKQFKRFVKQILRIVD